MIQESAKWRSRNTVRTTLSFPRTFMQRIEEFRVQEFRERARGRMKSLSEIIRLLIESGLEFKRKSRR